MFESMIIYIGSIILTVTGVTIFENKYYRDSDRKIYKFGFFCMAIIPIIISSIRYDVGTDYHNYYNDFYYYKFTGLGDIQNYTKGIEYIPLLIRYITNNIFKNPYIFFYITSIIINICVFIALYKRRRYLPISYSMLMYLCLHFGSSLNGIRQYMAIGIVLIAYTYLENKNLKMFIIAIVIAGLCHRTSYIVFLLYPLTSKKIKSIYKVFLIIGCIGLILGYDKFIQLLGEFDMFEKYTIYASDEKSMGIGLIIMNIPIFIILLLYSKRLKAYNSTNDMYIFFIIIGFFLKFLGYLSPFVSRLALYFDICQIILIPQLLCISRNKFENLMVKHAIVITSIFIFVYKYIILGNSEIFPYKTIFSML